MPLADVLILLLGLPLIAAAAGRPRARRYLPATAGLKHHRPFGIFKEIFTERTVVLVPKQS